VRISFAASAAFKEYKPAWRGKVDFSALEAMAAFLGGRSFTEGSELVERVAWPTKIVTDAGASVGFLMPEVPAEFLVPIALPSGARQSVLAGFQLLLNPPSYLARLGISVTERDRYLLLAEIAESLALFHRYDIAVGDLSPKNVLFSLTPSPRCFFVDADAMRLAGRGAMDQAETPDWEISTVSSEELATLATDRYKLGLLVLRLLAGDQSTRDPGALPPSVPPAVRGLIVGALAVSPASRPAAADWVDPLRAAAAGASTTVSAATGATQQSQPLATAARVTTPASVPVILAPSHSQIQAPVVATRPIIGDWSIGRRLAAIAVVVVVLASGILIARQASSSAGVPTLTSGSSSTFTVQALSSSGLQTVDLPPNTTVAISASGTWCMGGIPPTAECGGPAGIRPAHADEPDVVLPSSPIGRLIGTIGGGAYIDIGDSANIQTGQGGALTLLFNDRAGSYADNSGEIEVTLTVS
jgi:hypothetical protein